MNLKLLKFILFLPLFIACQAESEILPPDGDELGGASDFSLTLSEESLAFAHAYDYEPASLTVAVGDETVVVDMSGAPWMEVEGDVTVIAPNTEVTLNFVPREPNYSADVREGVIIFKGKYTKESVEVSVNQGGSYQDAQESLAEVILTLEHSVNSEVLENGDDGSFTGIRPGDAVLLRIPVKRLEAGTDVSAMVDIGQQTTSVKSQWAAEYWDEDQWKLIRKFNTTSEAGDYDYSTFICDFTLAESVENDYVKFRVRLLSGEESTRYRIASSPWKGAAMEINSLYPAIQDYKKLLIVGNSFTYYWGSPFVLKQIARSQGHRLDVRVHTDSDATLAAHSDLSLTSEAINEGGYHLAILQEQGDVHAKYADRENTTALSDANQIANAIKLESASCKIYLENTWSYSKDNHMGYGSYEIFDTKLQAGCYEIARSLKAEILPVGQAFARARENALDINCLHSDNSHPSLEGMYLKACVNYLKIYGGEFNDAPYCDNVSAENAEILRTLAYNTVNDIAEEKPREQLILTFDFTSSWPFSPALKTGGSKLKTKDTYTYTQDGVEYPIEIYAPGTGYYYVGGSDNALRFESTGGGYIRLPAIEGKALVELTVAITNTTGKEFYLSSDGSDKGDILNKKPVPKGSSATWELTGTLLNTPYYLYTKANHSQVGKIILTYE